MCVLEIHVFEIRVFYNCVFAICVCENWWVGRARWVEWDGVGWRESTYHLRVPITSVYEEAQWRNLPQNLVLLTKTWISMKLYLDAISTQNHQRNLNSTKNHKKTPLPRF